MPGPVGPPATGRAARGQPADLAAAARAGHHHHRRPACGPAGRVRLGRRAPGPRCAATPTGSRPAPRRRPRPRTPVLRRGLPGRLGGAAPPGPAADGQPGRRLRALGPATLPPRRRFEVIAGKSVPADGPAKCFGFVQTHDTKPKRRLFELLAAQGMQANQEVTFRTDGADDVRDLPLYLNPQAEHLLDWFHVTMRLTVLTQLAKGRRAPPPAASADSRLGGGARRPLASWVS